MGSQQKYRWNNNVNQHSGEIEQASNVVPVQQWCANAILALV
jgi:hypothetical protein